MLSCQQHGCRTILIGERFGVDGLFVDLGALFIKLLAGVLLDQAEQAFDSVVPTPVSDENINSSRVILGDLAQLLLNLRAFGA